MKAEDITKLPTPETDAEAVYGTVGDDFARYLEQYLEAASMALANLLRASSKDYEHPQFILARDESRETLAAITERK